MIFNRPINFITSLILTLLIFFLISGCNSSKEIIQPIAYNHAIHLSEAGMDCIDCHTGVENKMRATFPSIKKCKSCHSEMQGESEEEEKVVEAVSKNEEILWKRVYILADHIFFSHRRHVKSGKVSCTVCHGEVEKLSAPPPQPLVPISMDKCMKCHDNKSISNDCLTCHV